VLQQTVNGIALGATYSLLGLGVTLIWGVLRVLNFAYSQFIVWGAFGTLIAIENHVPTVFAVLIGMAVAGVVAVFVDMTVMQFMRRRGTSEFALVVATIGVYYILSSVAQDRSKSQIETFPIGGFPHGSVDIGSTSLPSLQLLSLVISVAVMIVLGYWLNRTRLGRATRTVAYSAPTAELLGVNSRAIFALAVFVSGCLAALAGIFNAADSSTLSYSDGDQLLVVAFAVIVLGGMGSVKGAVIGGLALGLVQVYTTLYVSGVFSNAITYLLIVGVLIVRPNGLFGVREEARV
jgi:branched-chain amino acid transport system permease protein